MKKDFWRLAAWLAVVGFAGLAILTTSLDNPPEESSTTGTSKQIEIDARVQFNDTTYKITNQNPDSWNDCKLSMNAGFIRGGFDFHLENLGSGEDIIIAFRDFTKGDGTRFKSDDIAPQNLSISCTDVGGQHGFGYFGIN